MRTHIDPVKQWLDLVSKAETKANKLRGATDRVEQLEQQMASLQGAGDESHAEIKRLHGELYREKRRRKEAAQHLAVVQRQLTSALDKVEDLDAEAEHAGCEKGGCARAYDRSRRRRPEA